MGPCADSPRYPQVISQFLAIGAELAHHNRHIVRSANWALEQQAPALLDQAIFKVEAVRRERARTSKIVEYAGCSRATLDSVMPSLSNVQTLTRHHFRFHIGLGLNQIKFSPPKDYNLRFFL